MSLTGFSSKVSSDGSILSLLKEGRVIEELPIIQATEEHRSLILSTWVRSYLPTARLHMPKDTYLTGEPRVAEGHWQFSKVVSSNDDKYAVHAWVCGLPGQLWMVYVPPELRSIGIARNLIRLVCGNSVQAARPWPYKPTPPRGFNWTHNPYLLQQQRPSGA